MFLFHQMERDVLFYKCGDGFMIVNECQNSLSCRCIIGEFYCTKLYTNKAD